MALRISVLNLVVAPYSNIAKGLRNIKKNGITSLYRASELRVSVCAGLRMKWKPLWESVLLYITKSGQNFRLNLVSQGGEVEVRSIWQSQH